MTDDFIVCMTCLGSGLTPVAMSFDGPHHRPAKISTGKCPSCAGGIVCPWCLYEKWMHKDSNGKPACGHCGWSAQKDIDRAKKEMRKTKQ